MRASYNKHETRLMCSMFLTATEEVRREYFWIENIRYGSTFEDAMDVYSFQQDIIEGTSDIFKNHRQWYVGPGQTLASLRSAVGL